MEINKQIDKLAEEDDIDGLIALINTLDDTNRQQHKDQLLSACENVFYYWLNALHLDKIQQGDEGAVVEVLFDLQAAMEKLAPQHALRGQLYEYSHDYEKAIEAYRAAGMHAKLAEALLNHGEVNYEEVLHHFKTAFSTWSPDVMHTFLQASSRVGEWEERFIQELETALAEFAKEDPYVYLEYAKGMPAKASALLDQLKDYDTNDTERLNELGHAFEKLHHYETALKFFKKGQQINPATWTFPVYATNVLLAMARLNPYNAVELFEEGRLIFAKTPEDFTLVLYWGDFLIEYARLAPEMLKEAEIKLSKAKDLGENYYDHPYRSLAKCALMMGDRQRCLEILQECKAAFSTSYFEYEHSIVLEDEDFREIWNVL